jgi:hypothetical protein
MKKSFVFLLLVVVSVFMGCWLDPVGHRETISQPTQPAGDATADIDESKTYVTGGAVSSRGHRVEYRFDLDADGSHNFTNWSASDSVSASWPDAGLYVVKAQARCAKHRQQRSVWSEGRLVAVGMAVAPPGIRFSTRINGVQKVYDPAAPLDTVGMLKPFDISYHGLSFGAAIEAYKFFPLNAGVTLPGENEWTTDLSDTLRAFPNTGEDALPSGVFRLAAQCRDALGAESPVDVGTFEEGVAQVVVNYDPDTQIFNLHSTYVIGDGMGGTIAVGEDINFSDGVPDTVPYDSWARIDYTGWDDARDGKVFCSPLQPDECVGFQVAYWKESVFNPAASEFSSWQPRTGVHDTDPFSATDSNTFHIGSLEYELYVRSVDEFDRPDGTPASVPVIGNFDPTLEMVAVEDHLGNQINLAILDTLTWNFWKGEGWPYVCQCDTVDWQQAACEADFACQGREYPERMGSFNFVKTWGFHIKASGHDHPKDPPPSLVDPLGSGIKSWRYMIQNSQGQFINLGKSNANFFEYKVDGQTQVNVLDDAIRWRVTYPSHFTDPPAGDPHGCTVFDNLPSWLNDALTVFLIGKDTLAHATYDFEQGIFINGNYSVINQFPDASLGRRTDQRVFAFVVRLVRPGPPDVCP